MFVITLHVQKQWHCAQLFRITYLSPASSRSSIHPRNVLNICSASCVTNHPVNLMSKQFVQTSERVCNDHEWNLGWKISSRMLSAKFPVIERRDGTEWRAAALSPIFIVFLGLKPKINLAEAHQASVAKENKIIQSPDWKLFIRKLPKLLKISTRCQLRLNRTESHLPGNDNFKGSSPIAAHRKWEKEGGRKDLCVTYLAQPGERRKR